MVEWLFQRDWLLSIREMIFPPDLSVKMEGLLNFLKGSPTYQSKSTLTDNRKEVKIDTLLKN